jgi:hypothetical protein
VEAWLEVWVDADDRHWRWQWTRPEQLGAKVGPPLERWRRDLNAGDVVDRAKRLLGQPGLAEGCNAEIGVTHEVRDRPVHGHIDPGVRREPGVQHRDSEGDADRRQRGAQRSGAHATPGQAVEPTHRLEPQLGESGDQRGGVVAGAPT